MRVALRFDRWSLVEFIGNVHAGVALKGWPRRRNGSGLGGWHWSERRVCNSRAVRPACPRPLFTREGKALVEWMTIRLDVSENEWRRHNKDMEPQRTGCVRPLHTRKRNRTLGLRKTARPIARAECRDKKMSAPSRRRNMSLDIPFYRTSPTSAFFSTWTTSG